MDVVCGNKVVCGSMTFICGKDKGHTTPLCKCTVYGKVGKHTRAITIEWSKENTPTLKYSGVEQY